MATVEMETRSAVTLLWQVKNLSHWNIKLRGRTLKSPMFKTSALSGSSWYLKLTPKGEVKGDNHIHVYLVLFRGEFNYSINCEMSFLGDGGLCLKTGSVRNEHLKKHKYLKLSPCLIQEEVYSTQYSTYLPSNTLIIQCIVYSPHIVLPAVDERISFFTNIAVNKGRFEWPIEKFSNLRLSNKLHRKIKSVFNTTSNCSIELNFSLAGVSLAECRIQLKIRALIWEPLEVKCKVSVKHPIENAIRSVEINHLFKTSKAPQTVDLPLFLSRQGLLNSLENDLLLLLCEFTVITGDYSETIMTNINEQIRGKKYLETTMWPKLGLVFT